MRGSQPVAHLTIEYKSITSRFCRPSSSDSSFETSFCDATLEKEEIEKSEN